MHAAAAANRLQLLHAAGLGHDFLGCDGRKDNGAQAAVHAADVFQHRCQAADTQTHAVYFRREQDMEEIQFEGLGERAIEKNF